MKKKKHDINIKQRYVNEKERRDRVGEMEGWCMSHIS